MKLTTLATVCLGAVQAQAAQYTDYFFRYSGGNDLIDGLRLRGNNSIDFYSPGVTQPPYNPEDHFNRLTTNATACTPRAVLLVVPTKPHPPPVPGYYGLSDLEGVPDAYRLVYTYRLDDAGAGFRYTEWRLQRTGEAGRVLLRYAGNLGREEGWGWVAVREESQPGGVEKWVPWYVKRSDANAATLAGWETEDVDLELVEAKGPVNSQAPGGVQE